MARYDPVRDSFRELNRLLIDSQTWNAAHEQRRADNAYRQASLMGDIAQREFSNRMAEKQYQLSVLGEERLAKESQHRMDIAKQQYLLDKQAAGRDAQRLKMTEAKHAFEMDKLEAETELAVRQVTPSPVNVSGLIDLTNKDAVDDLNRMLGKYGAIVTEDGGIFKFDGQPLMLKPYQQTALMPVIQSIDAKYDDQVTKVKSNILELENEAKALKKLTSGQDNYNLVERAKAKQRLKVIQPQILEHYKFFTNSEQLKYHNNKVQELQAYSAWMRQNFDEEAADSLDMQARKHMDVVQALQTQMAKPTKGATISAQGLNMVQLYERELKDGKAVGRGKAVYDKVNQVWRFNDGTVATELPPNLTAVEPTEKTQTDKKDPSLLSEFQMRNVKPYYEQEGMGVVIAQDAAKPKINKLGTMIAKVYRNLGSKAEDRLYIQTEVIDKVDELEAAYWNEVDQINEMSRSEIRAAANSFGITKKKDKTLKQQLKDIYYTQFADAARKMVGDPKFQIYRPNKTTRQMVKGLRMGE